MTDWPNNDGKMTSHSNFKLGFYNGLSNTDRGFLSQFGVIWEVWLPGVLN